MLDLGVDELGTDVRIYVFNFRDKLLNRFGSKVRSVVVFGSRARGNWKLPTLVGRGRHILLGLQPKASL